MVDVLPTARNTVSPQQLTMMPPLVAPPLLWAPMKTVSFHWQRKNSVTHTTFHESGVAGRCPCTPPNDWFYTSDVIASMRTDNPQTKYPLICFHTWSLFFSPVLKNIFCRYPPPFVIVFSAQYPGKTKRPPRIHNKPRQMDACPLCRRDGLANYTFIQFSNSQINHVYLTTDLPLWQVLNAPKSVFRIKENALISLVWSVV